MTVSLHNARHLTFSTLDQLWSSGIPMEIPIKGLPACRLQLDAAHGVLTLLTAYKTPDSDVARLKNIAFNVVAVGETDLPEQTIRVDGNVHAAYGLPAIVADEMQVEERPLAAAVASGIARYRSLLFSCGPFTAEKEVGLFGELLFLEFLFRQIGPGPAVTAWQGPMSEEHDFIFPMLHVEVKTTRSERRKHLINGLRQLVSLRSIPLSGLSIQITPGSPEGGPDTVTNRRTGPDDGGGHQAAVEARVTNADWVHEDADLYTTSWVLRSESRAYSLRDHFMATTPALIGPVVPNFDLVSEISYRGDLADLDHDPIPEPIGGFVKNEGSSRT